MNVYLYILCTLADWEIGFITAELNSERYFDKNKAPINIVKTGNTMDSITTMGGMIMNPDKCINDVVLMDNDSLFCPVVIHG